MAEVIDSDLQEKMVLLRWEYVWNPGDPLGVSWSFLAQLQL